MITVPLYNTERLREAQEADYETLCAIDRLCRDNGITYLLDSGTLLGAVRHQGFIPWDDDMDIAMTRENYEKFRSVAGNLPEEFELLEPEVFAKENRFYDFTPRVIYRNSKMRLWSEEQDFYGGRLNHLWVDIFILDGIPDGKIADFFTRFRQKVLYGFAMSKRFSLDMEKYKGKEKLFVKILTGLGRKMSMEKILARQERLSVKWNRKKTGRLYYSNYQPDYLHCTVQREWSERTVELPFEGGTFLCPEGYDQVLREVYGDYMTLPPEEKRVPTHSDEIEIYRNGQPAPVVFR